ncbi:MAG: DUF2764 family protein [Spirochaetaceae bacterium]|nr:MAG: DUF2764 family protein [Spirochaetaceae bacterium]
MAQYYYLVASLPLLFYETERIPSRDEFLNTCRQHLSLKDYRLLASASTSVLEPTTPSCRILERWRQWEIALRNELVRLRAKKRGDEAEAYIKDSPGIIEAEVIAREAFAQESPLQAEDTLNRARWEYLDDLEVGHYFDIETILIYALRLQVLERKVLFDPERGRDMFEKIYAEITSPVGVT